MTHLTVSIVASDAAEALAKARALPPQVTLVEYRLDMMARLDLARLARETPLPAIFTCRPPREGGHFQGSERERREILQRALTTGHWVDVELDTLPHLAESVRASGRVIGSHHNFEGMLTDWPGLARRMRELGAGVVKLVAMAADEGDVLPPLTWLSKAQGPAVAIAMGRAGVATRLLAPRFTQAFLTFAALDHATAPGQVRVTDWVARYGFEQVAAADPLLVALTPDPVPWERVEALRAQARARFPHRRPWVLPIPVRRIATELLRALRLAGVDAVARTGDVEISAKVRQIPLEPDVFFPLTLF